MAYISFQPSDYFNTLLYTGTGSTNAVTGVGFTPDMIWGKNRGQTYNHQINDTVRGVNKQLAPNNTNAEETNTGELTAFGSDGFTLGTGGTLNGSGDNIVAWNWRAGGSGSSNTDGSITSTVSASTTSGFSIVTYTGTGSNATVGHGLNSTPELIFTKRTNNTQQWFTYTSTTGSGKALFLDSTSAESTQATAYNSAPTSTVINYGTDNAVNGSSDTYVAYCFHSVKGFSRVGSYIGNGSTDGTFVYLGFKPAFVLIKGSSNTENWHMYDNKRDTFNPTDQALQPSSNAAEFTETNVLDFLSNGFKLGISGGGHNGSGISYIFMAFAEFPIVSSNDIPAVAR